MKKAYLILSLAGATILYTSMGIGGGASVEMGKQLFNDPGLSGSINENSCNSCHPDGRGLKKAGDKENLGSMINSCIQGPLKGESLPEESMELESLKLYIKSLND